ncbi:MAG TPA: response regulator transcription factor [Verrucomicrobiae bacterium]|nr:response regulator transcription factor [Verrucomicrobiae bacterium]
MNTIRVLLVEDHNVVRAGLRALLHASGDIEVIGEAHNGQEGVKAAQTLRPDLVLLDLGMPRLNGVQAARKIIRAAPRAKVLVLSAYSDEGHVREAMAVGVAGYVLKQSAGTDLLEAIRETAGGGAYFSPGISNHMLKHLRESWGRGRESISKPPLSERHAEVLQLIAEGYCTKQIAALLSISVKTAEKHRYDLMIELDIHKVASLTRHAVWMGVIESNRVPNWPSRHVAAPARKRAKNPVMM